MQEKKPVKARCKGKKCGSSEWGIRLCKVRLFTRWESARDQVSVEDSDVFDDDFHLLVGKLSTIYS